MSNHPLEVEFGIPNPNPNPNPQMEKKRHLLPPDSSIENHSPNLDSSMENPTPISSYPEEFTPFDVLFAEFMEESKAKRMKMTMEDDKSSSSSSLATSSTLEEEASSILTSLGKRGHRLLLFKPPPHLLPSAEARLSWAVEDLKQLLPTPPPLPLSRKLKLSPSPTPSPTPTPPSAQTQTQTPPAPHSAAAESTKTPPTRISNLFSEINRISKLKRILRIIKEMDSSLRRDSSSSSPPTRQEQRLYNLILCHVNTYIFLFYREDFLCCCSNEISLPLLSNDDDEPLRAAAAAAAATMEEEEGDEGEVDEDRQVYDYVVEKMEDYLFDCCKKLVEFLEECRPSIIPPEEDPLHQGVVIDDTKILQRKQQLLHILRDLKEMGRSRDYTPPSKGQEIECYKKIRDWITFSLLFIQANCWLRTKARAPDACKWDYVNSPHSGQPNVYVPHGHRFALTFDLMPTFRSLVNKCEHRASHIFLTANNTTFYQTKQSTLEDEEDDLDVQVNADVHVVGNDEGDADMEGVDIRTSQVQNCCRAVVMKSRLECLQIILSKLTRIAALPCNSFPTNKEVRLYAQIAEHVETSVWLFRMSTDAEKITGTGCHEVNVANINHEYCGLSAVPVTEENYFTRERQLLEIVSYLNAIKSSCLDAIPTREEFKYYLILSRGLHYSFMSCPAAADRGVEEDKIKPVIYSEEAVASLKSQLVSIYKSELNFIDEAKEKSASIINMLRRAIMPDEGESPSSEDAFKWLDENNVKLVDTLKLFFKGRPEQLDQFIVILTEMHTLQSYITFRLTDATGDARWRFFDRKEYAIVGRELHIARYIMNRMNHPISGAI